MARWTPPAKAAIDRNIQPLCHRQRIQAECQSDRLIRIDTVRKSVENRNSIHDSNIIIEVDRTFIAETEPVMVNNEFGVPGCANTNS